MMEGSISRGTNVRKNPCPDHRDQLRWRDPSKEVQKCAANCVLSNATNSDGEGYKSAQQTLYCQEGSTPIEGSISRGKKVRKTRCLV